MEYLKVGDGVWVNGEINPYNLGGWPDRVPITDETRIVMRSQYGVGFTTKQRLKSECEHNGVDWREALAASDRAIMRDPRDRRFAERYDVEFTSRAERLNQIDLNHECDENADNLARERGFDWKEAVAQQERDRKVFDMIVSKTKGFGIRPPESATDLVNRVAGEQRDDSMSRHIARQQEAYRIVEDAKEGQR